MRPGRPVGSPLGVVLPDISRINFASVEKQKYKRLFKMGVEMINIQLAQETRAPNVAALRIEDFTDGKWRNPKLAEEKKRIVSLIGGVIETRGFHPMIHAVLSHPSYSMLRHAIPLKYQRAARVDAATMRKDHEED